MLDARFRAQDEYDAEWARKTMALMFLRYANVKVFAVTRSSRIDPPGSGRGITKAQVVFTGAQDLVPERARPCSVELQWSLDGADSKLREVRWN